MRHAEYISSFDAVPGTDRKYVFSENMYFDLPGSTHYEELRMLVSELELYKQRGIFTKAYRKILRISSPIDNPHTRKFTEEALTQTAEQLHFKQWEQAGDERPMEQKKQRLKKMNSDRYLQSTQVSRCDDWDLTVHNAGFPLTEVRHRVGEYEQSHSNVFHAKGPEEHQRLLEISNAVRKSLDKDFVSDMVREWLALGYRLYEH